MEFIEQIAPEIKLTPEQVTALKAKGSEFLTTQKQSWESENREMANKNAENILNDVAKRVEAMTGIKREASQKYADYLGQSSELFLKGKENTLKEKEAKLQKLIDEGSGSEAVKNQLAETQKKLESLQQKEAIYAEYEKENYKDRFLALQKETETIKVNNAFISVKPKFSEKVNSYEAAAKWDSFVNSVLSKNNIEFDENKKPIAVDKENKFKITPLEKLVAENKELSELIKGSSVPGVGSKPEKTVTIDGVPFEVPENATSEQKTKAIRAYLEGKGMNKIHPEYAKEFSALMGKINAQKKA